MIADLQPYPSYRPSGIPWLGDAPGHWGITRLKAIARIRYGLGQPPRESPTGLPLIRATNVSRGRIVETDLLRIDPEDVPIGRDAFLREKEIIVVRSGAYTADSAIVPKTYAGSVAGYDMVLTATKAIPEFIAAALLAGYLRDDQLVVASTRAAQPHLNANELGTSVVLLPPLDEQRAIVRFLDHADEQTQRYIASKERLIALLEEERQALVHQAVTRGLDPNVRFKPSGVEWLGEIPEHWEEQEVKKIVQIKRGKFTHRPRNDPSLYDGPYPFIQTGDVTAATKIITGFKQTLNQRGLAVSTIFPAGTLVMTIAANIGDVAILNFDACFPDSVVGFIPNNVHRDHLYYMLRAMKNEFIREAPVNTQGNLNVDRIGSMKVALPPVQEQTTIAAYLDRTADSTNDTIRRAVRQIELMNEYRTRLIADVVTGQLDVREADKRLSDVNNPGFKSLGRQSGLELLSPEDGDAPPSSREGKG